MKTRNFLLILGLCISMGQAYSQNAPAGESCDSISWGAYGGPMLHMAHPSGTVSMLVGGQGAVVLNRQFALGGFGLGNTVPGRFNGAHLGYDEDLELSMGYGGVFLEYMFIRENPFHPSISLPVGLGGASVKKAGDDEKISTTRLFVFSPRLNFEFNLGENAVISFFTGYQIISSRDNFIISDDALSNWEYGINLKLGNF